MTELTATHSRVTGSRWASRVLRGRCALVALALLILACMTTAAHASCGLQGQRPCTVGERFPSCDVNLVEAAGQCVRPLCGRDGERACGPERLVFDFLLRAPVPLPCDVNLKLDILSGRCFHPGCGLAGGRACTVFERLPSCDLDLTEVNGRCVRPQCGRLNERPCNVPAERLIISAAPGYCDAGLVLDPMIGLCLRPATPYARAAPVTPQGSASGSAAPPPTPPASPAGVLPPPPPRPGLPPPPSPPPIAAAAAGVGGAWRINGNGFVGDIAIQQGADGALTGTVYGDPLTGWHAPGERSVLFLRGPSGRPIQFLVAQLAPDGSALGGRLFALNAHSAGGSSARNVFGFSAQRQGTPANPALPGAMPGPPSVAGSYTINGNGFVGPLVLVQAADGGISGTVYNDRIEGHYAAGSGSLVFVRYSGAAPIQVFTGTVAAGTLRGDLHALLPAAGASAQRARFDWSAQPGAAAAPDMSRNLR